MVTQLELDFTRRVNPPAPSRAELTRKLRVCRAHLAILPDGHLWAVTKRRERELIHALRHART